MKSIEITYDRPGYYKIVVSPGEPLPGDTPKVRFMKASDADWTHVEITGPGGEINHWDLLGKGRDKPGEEHHYEFGTEYPIEYDATTSAEFQFVAACEVLPAEPPTIGTVKVP